MLRLHHDVGYFILVNIGFNESYFPRKVNRFGKFVLLNENLVGI